MARRRIFVSGSWLLVAFLLLRIAWGGGPTGIVYVVMVSPPAMLAGGALALVASIALAVDWWRSAGRGAARRSAILAAAVIPFGIWLTFLDHRSGWGIAAAAAVAALAALGGVQNR